VKPLASITGAANLDFFFCGACSRRHSSGWLYRYAGRHLDKFSGLQIEHIKSRRSCGLWRDPVWWIGDEFLLIFGRHFPEKFLPTKDDSRRKSSVRDYVFLSFWCIP